MTIERIFPPQVEFEDGLQIGAAQPDAIINKSPFGPATGMTYSARLLRSYSGRFADIAAGDAKLLRLESLFEQCPPTVGTFWIKEVISGEHRNLRSHNRGDGTKTTFVVPVSNGGSVDAVFVNDVPVAAADFTVIDSANLVASDNECNGDGDSATVPTGVTSPSSDPISVTRTLADIGYTSFLVEPAAAKTDVELMAAKITGLDGTLTYTVGASYLAEPGNYDLIAAWLTAADATALTTTDNAVYLAAGWYHHTVTVDAATIPDTVTKVQISVKRKHSSGAPMYVGAFQLSDGDNTELFLPDSAPMLVKFDTAPAEKAEVAFSCTGNRMTKVKLVSKTMAWKQYDIGHVLPGKFSAIEVRQ